jgi:hypothetical protein
VSRLPFGFATGRIFLDRSFGMNWRSLFLAGCSVALVSSVLADEWVSKTVRYELDGTTFESTIVFQADVDEKRPGVLMVPNWMGPT